MAIVVQTVRTYALDGSTKDFIVPFEYLARKFVQVSLLGTAGRKQLVLNSEFRFSTKNQVTLLQAWGPANGYDRVELRRHTSSTERLVDFTDGSILRATDLNISQIQAIHIAEEARDAALLALPQDDDGNLDAKNRRIVNLAPGINAKDAINKQQLDETLGEAGGVLSDVKGVQGEIYDYIEKLADDTSLVRGVSWVYNNGSANGGEKVIQIDKPTRVYAVPYIEVNGSRQEVGYHFEFDGVAQTITLAKPLETGDFLMVMTTESHLPLEGMLASTVGAASIGTASGNTVQGELDALRTVYIKPEQFGAKGGEADDTDAVSDAIAYAESSASLTDGAYTPVSVIFDRTYRVTRTLTIHGGKVRLRSLSGGGIYFDPDGAFTDNRCMVVTGSGSNSAYTGQTGSIFDGMRFTTSGKNLDLIHAVRNSSSSGDNGACLHNVTAVTARGFKRVFTHASGGWGWTWFGCQFSGCSELMKIITAADTYERHTFVGCTWQNGGYAFLMDNPDGKVYWIGGSIDYCDGLADITSGHISTSGHNEWTARTQPLVVIRGPNASVSVSGTLFIRNNTSTPYVIFQQYKKRQVALNDLTLVTDGVNASRGTLSNLEVIKQNLFITNEAGMSIAYHSADEELLLGDRIAADYSLTSSTNHEVSMSGGKLTVTSKAGGTNTHLYVDIAITGSQKVAFKMVASNGSSKGPVFLNKYILTAGKSTIANVTSSGTAQWAAGSSSVAGGSVTVFDVPKQAAFLRLDFNLVNLVKDTTFSIESLKMFTY